VFEKLLEILCLFHQHKPENINFDPYSLYILKLEQRFKDYNYTRFSKSQEVYESIKAELSAYVQDDLGVIGCIHGDPVFSNVLVDRDSMVKLVDPRGLTANDQLCVFGDVMYDYAKILQSLCGYDEILLTGDRFLDNTSMIKKLNTHVRQTHGEQYVKLIKHHPIDMKVQPS
jgi:thiamine kinase-like enzyme